MSVENNSLKSGELYLPMPNGRYLLVRNSRYWVLLLVVIAWLLRWLLRGFLWMALLK